MGVAIRTRVALAVSLVALAVTLVVVLSNSSQRRSGTNGIPSESFVADVAAGETACLPGEVIPADTAAVRLTIGTYDAPAPRLTLTARAAGRLVTVGELAPGWRQGIVSIPVALVRQTTPGARVCLYDYGPAKLALGGTPYSPGLELSGGAGAVRTLSVGVRFDYLRPGSESWFSLLPTLWHRMTFAKGDIVRHWAPWGALLLMLAAAGLALRAAVREDRRALWLCTLVGLANGVAWSLIVPPFEVPDENAHYAYVAELAERGRLPHSIPVEGRLSPAEDAMLAASGYYRIVGIREDPSPFTQVQQQQIDLVARMKLPAKGTGDALGATNGPPLYYMLEAVPFKLAPGGSVLNRLVLMRLLSALLGALTVAFAFLLISELVPGTPWASSAGALVVAFQPLFGFISSGVNYDVMLYACATGLLLAIARAFKRGLTRRAGVEIGLALGLGLVSKVAMDGLIPAVAVALGLLLWRARGRGAAWRSAAGGAPWRSAAGGAAWRSAAAGAAAAVLVAAIPVVAYLVWNHFSAGRAGLTAAIAPTPQGPPGMGYSVRAELSHIWQLFLPNLWMAPQFAHLPLWHTWFRGLYGVFGWLDYSFSDHTLYFVAAIVGCVCVLAGVGLARSRASLRRHLGVLAVLAVAVVGICAEIGIESYRIFLQTGTQFEQARYLLPLIGLYGLIVAFATRAGGPRWGAAIGVVLVVLALGDNLLSQMLTIQRYYS